MAKYDSQFERDAAPILKKLGCRSCKRWKTPVEFRDASGAMFKAKPDFYHPLADLCIEIKCASLNDIPTKSESVYQLSKFPKPFQTFRHWLKFGWNHSIFKQASVQKKLTPSKFIVVFRDALSYEDCERYKAAGLIACTFKSLPSYLAVVILRNHGVGVSFNSY